MVYGCYGFTGRLIVERAIARGLRPVVAGRDRARVRALAERWNLPARDFALDDTSTTLSALADVEVVLNAAGPFSATAKPLVDACVRTRTHYLDISGEVASMQAVADRHAQALQASVMLLPGVGFDVVPSDCLAAFTARRVGGARRLRIGIAGLRRASRGSLRSILEQAGKDVWVRERGELRAVPAPALARHPFDYGRGPSASVAVSWGDLVTAYHSTGCPEITTYFEATTEIELGLAVSQRASLLLQRRWARAALALLPELAPEGPGPEQRSSSRACIVVEATSHSGVRAVSRLRTPDVYELTAASAVGILERLAQGAAAPGFQTPSLLLGCDFAMTMPGVEREVLA